MKAVIFLLALALIVTHGCAPTTQGETPSVFSPQAADESMPPELVIVYDNNPFDDRVRTAWGFSCLIRLATKTILFDTGGDSPTLLHNMRQLEIDPGEVDIVVLSHIHGDHVGGLRGFLEQNHAVTVCLLQSFSDGFKDEVKSLGAKVEEVFEARELFSGVYTTGELGNGTKEQALIVTTSKGLAIITGCAHPGVVNIIRVAREIVPEDKVYLVVGGFHLAGASSAQIGSIVQQFCQLSVENVAPCHCSGDETRRLFKESYGEAYVESGVGARISLP